MKDRIMFVLMLALGILFAGAITESQAQTKDEATTLSRAAAFALAEFMERELGLPAEADLLIDEYTAVPIPKMPTESRIWDRSSTSKHPRATLQHLAQELGGRVMVPTQGVKCDFRKACHIEGGTLIVSVSELRVEGASAEVTVDLVYESSLTRTGVGRITLDVSMDQGQDGWVPLNAVVRGVS